MTVLLSSGCDFAADEMLALRWWRSEVSRSVDRFSTLKNAAQRDRRFADARAIADEIAPLQRLAKAISLFLGWLDDGVPQRAPWPAELAAEVRRVDHVLVFGVAPRRIVDLFPGIAA